MEGKPQPGIDPRLSTLANRVIAGGYGASRQRQVDDAVLALLYLTSHEGFRAWKGHDCDAVERLHRKGMIEKPVGKTKSVLFTEQGLAASKRLFIAMFVAKSSRG